MDGPGVNMQQTNADEYLTKTWLFLEDYGYYVIAAGVLLFWLKGKFEIYLDERRRKLSLAAANAPARVNTLDAERQRVRALQQKRAEAEAAKHAGKPKPKKKKKKKEGFSGEDKWMDKWSRGGNFNPMNPSSGHINTLKPRACGPKGGG